MTYRCGGCRALFQSTGHFLWMHLNSTPACLRWHCAHARLGNWRGKDLLIDTVWVDGRRIRAIDSRGKSVVFGEYRQVNRVFEDLMNSLEEDEG